MLATPATDRDGGDGADAGSGGGAPAASCAIADRGLGPYRPWQRLERGAVLIPQATLGPRYDLLLHFHGSEAVRKVLAPAGLPLVIAALDAGQGSQPYRDALQDAAAFARLLASVQTAVENGWGTEPELRHVALSSWSAGYGGVGAILRHHPKRPAAVVLLDSLHASYRGGHDLAVEELQPFLELAERARDGEQLLVIAHAEIRPPDFASTAETASYLLGQLGGQRRYAGLRVVAGLQQKTEYRQGGLLVQGFTGTSRAAHCAHLSMLLPILRDEVLPRLDD